MKLAEIIVAIAIMGLLSALATMGFKAAKDQATGRSAVKAYAECAESVRDCDWCYRSTVERNQARKEQIDEYMECLNAGGNHDYCYGRL